MKVRHVVLFQISSSIPRDDVAEVLEEYAQTVLGIEGMIGFSGGPNVMSNTLSQGFTHCYTIDFINSPARDAYLTELNEDHIGQRISEITVGGLGGILTMNVDITHIREPNSK